MNERNGLWCNLSVASTVAIAGKQADKATPILDLSLAILLLPILSGSFWNSSSLFCCACLFLIIILFRVNDPITEESSKNIPLAGRFEQGLPFESQGRNGRCYQGKHFLVVEAKSGLCGLPLAKYGCTLWF